MIKINMKIKASIENYDSDIIISEIFIVESYLGKLVFKKTFKLN